MKAVLRREDAAYRSKYVLTGLKYELALDLSSENTYKGTVKIVASLKSVPDKLFLDYAGYNVTDLSINSTALTPEEIKELVRDAKVYLPQKYLREGQNELILTFNSIYDADGYGLMQYSDAEGNFYLYTNCEPYYMNRVFPLFDQPDLKASIEFSIFCPDSWTVASNANPISRIMFKKKTDQTNNFILDLKNQIEDWLNDINPEGNLNKFQKLAFSRLGDSYTTQDKKLWHFEPSDNISSYLFAFIAGDFVEVFDHKSTDDWLVPAKIYTTKTTKDQLTKQLPEVTPYIQYSISFYETFFGVSFPFKKCDFVFCPKYPLGGMENAGLITLNDKYIYDHDASSVEVSKRGITIAHEIAHMWFGDLVTMRWWGDLWLNESFADFCGYICEEEIQKKFPFPTQPGWENMPQRKNWGYKVDRSPQSHPIACEIKDTDEAVALFDGITYAKGASVVKQLYVRLGKDPFSKGLKTYFEKNKWGSTELSDFFEAFKGLSDIDLDKWKNEWIMVAGLNEIKIDVREKNKKSYDIFAVQTAHNPKLPLLRNHSFTLAFFNADGTINKGRDGLARPQKSTFITNIPAKDFVAVLPNFNDHTFAKILLDKESNDFFSENLGLVDHRISQMIVFRSFYDQLLDVKITPAKFLEIFGKYLQKIKTIPSQTLETIAEYVNEAFRMWVLALSQPDLSDEEIDLLLGVYEKIYSNLVAERLEFKNDINYLSNLYGTISSRVLGARLFASTSRFFLFVDKLQQIGSINQETKDSFIKNAIVSSSALITNPSQFDLEFVKNARTKREEYWKILLDSFVNGTTEEFLVKINSWFLWFPSDEDRANVRKDAVKLLAESPKDSQSEKVDALLKLLGDYFHAPELYAERKNEYSEGELLRSEWHSRTVE